MWTDWVDDALSSFQARPNMSDIYVRSLSKSWNWKVCQKSWKCESLSKKHFAAKLRREKPTSGKLQHNNKQYKTNCVSRQIEKKILDEILNKKVYDARIRWFVK